MWKLPYSICLTLIAFLVRPLDAFADPYEGCRKATSAPDKIKFCSIAIARTKNPTILERAHNKRGLAYMETNQYGDAVKDFTTVIKLDHKIAGYYDNRQNALRLMGRLPEALADANKAILLAPTYSFVYRGRGLVYDAMGQYQLAIKDFGSAISIAPQDIGLRIERGKIFEEAGLVPDAINDFSFALQINPKSSGALKERGLLLKKQNAREAALADLVLFTQLAPLDPDVAQALQEIQSKGEVGTTETGASQSQPVAPRQTALSVALAPTETQDATRENNHLQLEKASAISKSLIEDAAAFLKSDPANPNTLAIAEAIATANAALGTNDLDQIEKTSSALSQALHNDTRFADFSKARAEQHAKEINRYLHDAIKLARQQRGFMTRYIIGSPTSAVAAAFLPEVKKLEGEIASANLDQLRATTDEVNALFIKDSLRNQFLASSATDLEASLIPGAPDLSLAVTDKNRFLMTGDLRDIVFMFNSSAKAPHVAKNLRGEVVFDGSTASVCFFQKAFDAALVQRTRTTLAPYGLQTVSFHQACGTDTLVTNDLVVVRRGDFLRQSSSYASALLKEIELGDFKQLTTFTRKMGEAEDQSRKARRQQLEADIESGAADGFGVIFLVKNTSQTICAAVSSQARGHQALLSGAMSRLADRMGAHPSIEITPIETAFDLSQHNKCGMVYASASHLQKLLSALKKQAIDYSVEDIWFKPAGVARAESDDQTTQSQADKQEADRVRKADDERKLATQREADLAATKAARQTALRREFGKIAASSAAAIADDIKRFVDGGGKDQQVAQTYPNFAAWYQALLKDHWELMTMDSTLTDYGTVRWKGRKLTAGITAISFRLQNRSLGEYKDACFEFGHVIDDEFNMFRDPVESPCDDKSVLSTWKGARSFESNWIAQ